LVTVDSVQLVSEYASGYYYDSIDYHDQSSQCGHKVLLTPQSLYSIRTCAR